MVNVVIQSIYFLLPYALANMAPPLFKKINFLGSPLDFGKKLGGKRILGKNKTWRGLLAAIIGGIVGIAVQAALFSQQVFRELSIINFQEINVLLLGTLVGIGTIFGDSLGSFIKRRSGVKPGASFLLLDQLVGPLGMLLFISPIVTVSGPIIGLMLLLTFIGHIIIKHIGYWLKVENTKW